jgi:hypothetical protein
VEYDDELPPQPLVGVNGVHSWTAVSSECFVNLQQRLQSQFKLATLGERAVIREWSTAEGRWTKRNTLVLINPVAFARGNMRSSYYVIDFSCIEKTFVAKKYRRPTIEPAQYFDDVAMHSIAEFWAQKFNRMGPPKTVRFVPAAVLELITRSPRILLAVEPHLSGEFIKHNNNNGFVSDDQRCTPQAFSHFTFHCSGGQLMIVDIQGVGDDYTDPQILSRDGQGYGRGNLGQKGMRKFFKTHRCNAVCELLGLPVVRAGSLHARPVDDAASSASETTATATSSSTMSPQTKKHRSPRDGASPRDGRQIVQHLPPASQSHAAIGLPVPPPPAGAWSSIVRQAMSGDLMEYDKTLVESPEAAGLDPPGGPLSFDLDKTPTTRNGSSGVFAEFLGTPLEILRSASGSSAQPWPSGAACRVSGDDCRSAPPLEGRKAALLEISRARPRKSIPSALDAHAKQQEETDCVLIDDE